jgi:uncharacterized protein YneF (UPF0154 family)
MKLIDMTIVVLTFIIGVVVGWFVTKKIEKGINKNIKRK